jgi:hypothetical protein
MKTVIATTYERTFSAGRTKPAVFLCETDGLDAPCEVVVKFRSGMGQGVIGLASELLAALLARQLDIPTPEPMLVEIDPALADGMSDADLRTRIRGSGGLNFGCRLLTGGYETWPVGRAIPFSLRQAALEMFAFDLLIQNPDRRREKPNLLWKGDELYAIDHEAAFSFVYDILGGADPFDVSSLPFVKNHVFFAQLRGKEHDLERFAGALETVTDERLQNMMQSLPPEWRSPRTMMMVEHLLTVTGDINQFIDQIRRVLA